MAWARKRTRNRGHPDTRRDCSAPGGRASGPSAGRRVLPSRSPARPPGPSATTSRGLRLGSGCQGHAPSGRLELRQRPVSAPSMGRLGNLAQRGAVPWPRSHGEGQHPPTALGAAAKPPTVLLKKRRAARTPPPQSLSLCPVPSPTLEVNVQNCPWVRPGGAGTHPSSLPGPAGPAATHLGGGAAAPGPGRPAGRAPCLRGRVLLLPAAEAGRRSTEHALGQRQVQSRAGAGAVGDGGGRRAWGGSAEWCAGR